MPPPASGTYAIHSAHVGDHRFVQNNNGLLQLEYVAPGAGYSNQQRFQVTLTANGTYSISSLSGGGNTGVIPTAPQDIGPDGVQALLVAANHDFMRWTIRQAVGTGDPTIMNIIMAQSAFPGAPPIARQECWNRVDPDNQGRLQLVGVGADSHNYWVFYPA
jgi:hypothetical protein